MRLNYHAQCDVLYLKSGMVRVHAAGNAVVYDHEVDEDAIVGS
jgi:hypothetical protein